MAETILSAMVKDGLKMDDAGGIEVGKAIDRLRAGVPMWWGFSTAVPVAVDDGMKSGPQT